jgi:alkanesulfonate monooxygenase SsuD/methylene tetrahydromethanopterin reductase-like flavin-dependent oxidoreductase (luciferase family)
MSAISRTACGLIRATARPSTTRSDIGRIWRALAERGKFDGIFLAGIVGVYDVYRGGPAPSIIDQVPVNDPMMVVPVMAAVTEHIGFGVTANLTYEPPYLFAVACRRWTI